MAWRSNKKGLAIVAAFLFLMGVVVPAAFGLLTEKAMQLGVGDLLDKSTNWDESNIANSTYFVEEKAVFTDADAGEGYNVDIVLDEDNSLDIAMLEQTLDAMSTSATKDSAYFKVELNNSALDGVDKIVVVARILDKANLDLTKAHVNLKLFADGWNEQIYFEEYNATEAYNNTVKFEIAIDAIKRLKLESATSNAIMQLNLLLDDNTTQLNNVIWGYRVELYDVKKVNASSAANIMLATSGILGWVGALAATPYWNPASNREHRNVRRAYRKVRGKVRRRR